jgi:hypothetical protein
MNQREANFRSYFWVRGFQDSRQEIVNGTLGMLYPSPISASNRLKLSIITSSPDFVVDLLHTFLGWLDDVHCKPLTQQFPRLRQILCANDYHFLIVAFQLEAFGEF